MRKLLSLVLLMIGGSSLLAQEIDDRSLTEILASAEEKFNVKFSFDPELIELVEISVKGDFSFDELISRLEKEFPFNVASVGNEYYVISTVETTYTLQVSDSIDNQSMNHDLIVLVNSSPIPILYKKGVATFSYKPNLRDTLVLYSLGYEKRPIDIRSLINAKILSTTLSSPVLRLSEVTIQDYLTRGINLNPAQQSIDIAVKDLPLLPGETDGDLFASITALPGVTNPDSRAGNLFIRGSDTDQTLVLYDNIPIYHKGHYYGSISPYNPKIVDNVQVYRGGFHPRYGERVGGAVVINTDKNPSAEPSFGVGVNTLFGMAYVKAPLANNKLGITLGARRSLPSDFQSYKLKAITESVFSGIVVVDANGNVTGDVDVLFEDYHGKVAYKINTKNRISLSAIYTNTVVKSSILEPMGSFINPDHNQLQNLGFNIDLTSRLNSSWTSNSTVTISDYKYNYTTVNSRGDTPPFFSVNELKDFNVRQEFSWDTNKLFSSQFGLDYKWQEVLIDYLNIPSDSTLYSFRDVKNANFISPFANLQYNSDKWFLQLGLRGTYYSLLDTYKFTPRLFVNYDMNDWLTFKGSVGRYNQYISQVKNLEFGGGGIDNEVWTLADGEQGNIINGTQTMFGTLFHFDRWILDIEAFNKTANGITVYENRRLDSQSDFFTMDQRTYGIDFLFKRQISDHGSLWLGYSYADSEIKLDTTDVISSSSKYVQPHVWYIGGAYAYNNWKVSATWKYSSGLNAQSLDIIYAELLFLRPQVNNQPQASPAPGTTPPQRPDNPFENRSERYPYMHSFDLSASYKIPKTDQRKWSATFGLSLINVFDQKILVDQVYRGADGFQNRYAMGFAPNFMVMFEW